MRNQLQKVIDLARKTGSRMIVFDAARPEEAYVVMGVSEYEQLLSGVDSEVRGLTEEELLDKINRDIAIWRSGSEFEDNGENNASDGATAEKSATLEEFYSAPFRQVGQTDKKKFKNNWAIPPTRKKTSEEIIEEDRQYLEFTK